MNLSKNFTLDELTVTDTGLLNPPTLQSKQALTDLVLNVLQPTRDLLGIPITVTSGYRSDAVNKAVGGAKTSQHCKGEAADLVCSDNRLLFEVIRGSVVFDQLIWEYGTDEQPQWVHVSYRSQGNRGEVLRAVKENGRTTYKRI